MLLDATSAQELECWTTQMLPQRQVGARGRELAVELAPRPRGGPVGARRGGGKETAQGMARRTDRDGGTKRR
nr:unnamed protein product [Digitaria exilis]